MLTDERLLGLTKICQEEQEQILQYLVKEELVPVSIENFIKITGITKCFKTIYNNFWEGKVGEPTPQGKYRGITISGRKFIYVNWK